MKSRKRAIDSTQLLTNPPAARLTAPFGFQSRLESPRLRFDGLPFIDILMIGVLIAFLQSTFIFQPGIGVELPQSLHSDLSGERVSRVFSVTSEGTFFMDGRPFRSLQGVNQYIRDNPPQNSDEVLLVLIPRNKPMESVLQITEVMQSGGFQKIQIGARSGQLERRLP